MNLIYLCVFYQESYIKLLKLLLESLIKNGNLNNQTTDILILTSDDFISKIQDQVKDLPIKLNFFTLSCTTIFESASARLKIFNYEHIHKYDKILYIDTDILVNSNINRILNLSVDSTKIYALEEGTIGQEWWGSQFFDFKQYDSNTKAFTTGILLFKNSESIRTLFQEILAHINQYVYVENKKPNACLEQPFVVYNAFIKNQYDTSILKTLVKNSPKDVNKEFVLYHFPGGPGNYTDKHKRMMDFLKKMNFDPKSHYNPKL